MITSDSCFQAPDINTLTYFLTYLMFTHVLLLDTQYVFLTFSDSYECFF